MDRTVLPIAPRPFEGHVGRIPAESEPSFPEPVPAPEGAPNVVLIMTDDIGFGSASTFGGPIPTPNLDCLAQTGVIYILDRDLFDHAIDWVHNQKAAAPDKPFFLYLAPGSAHAPHQAPGDWIEKFHGRFDEGWDALRRHIFEQQQRLVIVPKNAKLTPRPDIIPPWDSLTPGAQKVQARMMGVYAAMIAFQDYQFGRLLSELERMDVIDNTLLIFIEGDNGGTAEGGLNGVINHAGQMANTTPKRIPWYYGPMEGSPLDYDWELYYLPDDYSQAVDISNEHPDKLIELQKRWDVLAGEQNIYPISDDISDRNFADVSTRRELRDKFVYWGADVSVPQTFGPSLGNRSFTIEADLAEDNDRLDGVIAAVGGNLGGWSFYVKDHKPVAYLTRSVLKDEQYRIVGEPLPAGKVTLLYEFTYEGTGRNGPGSIRIYANGSLV